MFFSTKARYGLRAMVELAMHYGKGALQLREVARRQGVSEKYLEHLFRFLRMAGLVRSVRGTSGGYVLARPPREITVLEVVEALEGVLDPVECVGSSDVCQRWDICVARDVWCGVKDVLCGYLSSITLETLAEKAVSRIGEAEL